MKRVNQKPTSSLFLNLVGPTCRSAWTRGSASLPRSGTKHAQRFRRILLRIAASWLVMLCTVAPGSATDLAPARLRCEYADNPLGIDVAQPRLYWTLESKERGQRQTAYQILAASSPTLLAKDTGDLWDTGKVVSDETIHIRYAGKELKSSQPVFWKVRVWDKDDRASAWSSPATWTMGVLGTNDPPPSRDSGAAGWKAKWICAPAATETLLLRKEFIVKPGLKRALAHVTGLGQYELNLNGRKAGDDLLSPGWTDYSDTVLYDTKDVTSLLREGRNAVGLTLGNGMYNVVRRNRFVKFTGSFGPLRAICQLELEYADGSTEIVGTDETWRTAPGPIIFSSIYGGEDYDARLNPKGWDQPKFDDQQLAAGGADRPPAGPVARAQRGRPAVARHRSSSARRGASTDQPHRRLRSRPERLAHAAAPRHRPGRQQRPAHPVGSRQRRRIDQSAHDGRWQPRQFLVAIHQGNRQGGNLVPAVLLHRLPLSAGAS